MKVTTLLVILLVALITLPQFSSAIAPGVIASVNTNSLSKLIRSMSSDIFENLRKMPIPNAGGRNFFGSWDTYNTRVTALELNTIKVEAKDGIVVDFSNINLQINTDVKFRVLFVRSTCSATARVHGGRITYRLYLHPGDNSRLKVDVKNLDFRFPKAKIQLHGNILHKIIQFFINTFSNILSGVINSMRSKINQRTTQIFTTMLNKTILRLPVDKWGVIDFALTKSVTYPSNNIIASFNGETSAKGHTTPTLKRHNIDLSPHSNLLQMKFDSFFFNSFFQAFHASQGPSHRSQYTHSRPNGFPLPLKLDPASSHTKRWNAMSPAILQKYSNKSLTVSLDFDRAPEILFSPGSIHIHISPIMSFYEQETLLFSVLGQTDVSTTATIAQKPSGESVLKLQFSKLSVKFKTVQTSIGPINFDAINELTKFINDVFTVPVINSLIGDGFPLPSSPALKFVNTKVAPGNNELYLTCDIQYVRENMRAMLTASDEEESIIT